MADFKKLGSERLIRLREENRKSRIYRRYQLMGLIIADLLGDIKHKSLYIKLAKNYNTEKLLAIAKDVAERKNIENKGAYFMKILANTGIIKKSK